jgi:hypothetical protein
MTGALAASGQSRAKYSLLCLAGSVLVPNADQTSAFMVLVRAMVRKYFVVLPGNACIHCSSVRHYQSSICISIGFLVDRSHFYFRILSRALAAEIKT